jgi:predicted RNase H-like HicB family nuclease
LRELYFTVLLEPDEDDRAVYRASVPGLAGCVSALGSPRWALDAARAALEAMLPSLSPEERDSLRRAQAETSPRKLRPGARLERVEIRAPVAPVVR